MSEPHLTNTKAQQNKFPSHADTAGFRVLLKLLSPQFKKHRLRLFFGFVALLCVDFLQLIIPRILKYGVDALSENRATSGLLFKLGLVIISISVMVVILRFIWRNLIIGFSRYLERALRNQIFNHIVTMDQPFFETRTTGDIMAHGSNDLGAVQMACGMGMVAAADALILSIAAIGFMLHIHPLLTVMALLPMPILAVSTRLLSGKLHHRFNKVQEQFSLITEFARSALISVKLSKAYTLENLQFGIFDKLGKTYVKANIRVALVQGTLFPAATLIGNLGLLVILLYGGRLVIQKDISMGDFVAFITYLQMLIWPMMAIGWVTNLLQRGLTSLKRIHSLISSEPILTDQQQHARPESISPTFFARNLSFSYPSSDRNQLEDINIDVRSGIIGIAGRTGSGKSTLCKLLLRLYPVSDNCLFFGNQDVNSLSLDDVRSQIAYVSQEPVLFSDTIRKNISFGVGDSPMSNIEKAAREAQIHEDITGFSSGYDTIIGERGVTLSGGQRQRLALARALLCNRPVLIIDDGLSAVDTTTENEIADVLRQRLTGKAVFIVSNRIKLLSMTDKILILEEGRLVNEGTHETLINENEFYRSMYLKQKQSGRRED